MKANKLFFLLAVLVICGQPLQARAQPAPASSPCDATYYQSLKSRAWLEAQREITQNQNLIFKPDSVLEYTCFDRFLDELAEDATNMFSETTRWGAILPSNSMDQALQSLVGTALTQYINNNFGHNFLGARASINYTPSSITGGSYSCDRMNEVWKIAKCWNFIADAGHDGFYTFQQYSTGDDKRFLPDSCGAALPGWGTEIGVSTGAATPWVEDNVVTYLNQLNPANCSSANPIGTGIIVYRPASAPTEFEEKVCIPPGCYYDPGGDVCATSP